jgi:hypothetical protein
MPRGFQVPDIAGAYIGGRQARQQEDYAETRNALARMEAEQAPREIANRNALMERQQQQFTQEQAMQALTKGKAAAEHIAQHPQAKAFAAGQFPEFVRMAEQRAGKPWDALTDQEVQAFAGDFAQQAAAKLGLSPAQRPVQLETIEGPGGSILQRDPTTGALKHVLGREPVAKQDKPQSRFRAMSPGEIQQAGLPAGSSAQIDENTGKIDVLSKKDTSATLSQKDATTAKIKLNALKVARQQLENVRQKFGAIKGTMQAGKGQGWVPSEKGEGFDKAVDSMKGSLTAITRTPGVGSMSDYESKIDQAKFPNRGDYESVTADQIEQLDMLLSTIEAGYSELLGGGTQQRQETAPQSQGIDERGYQSLPSGTVYRAPDGSLRKKR